MILNEAKSPQLDKEYISIIIPVYNVAAYLPECLESICRQTYRKLEIILVDDGSTDESGKICDEWSRQDSRIKVIHKANGGVSSARNAGLEASTGDLIGFIDADDWIEPEMYEKLAAAIQEADASCCGYVDYPMGTLDKPVQKGIQPCDTCDNVKAAMNMYMRDGYFTAVWNKLFRKNVLWQESAYIQMDTELFWGEDEVWLAQVIGNCKRISFVPEALYHWRPTAVSASRNNRITEKQMTLLTAKQTAIQLLPQDRELISLVKSRMFNDCFSIKVTAYYAKDVKKYHTIRKALKSVQAEWSHSPDITRIRKIKVRMMEAGMKLHLPGKFINKINNIGRFGIKRE